MGEMMTFPDVYVLSKFPKLLTELKINLPEAVNVVSVDAVGLDLHTQSMVELPEEIIEELKDAEILVTEPTCSAYLLYKLPKLKWIQNTRAGVDLVMNHLDPCKPLPLFKMTRYCDHYLGDLVANYVIAQIINVERNLFSYHDLQKQKKWERPSYYPNFRVLKDLTIGVLGAGVIGTAVGKLLKSVRCKVIAFVHNPRHQPSDSYDRATSDLQVILNESDYICNTLPSTNETKGLLDNDVLKACERKPVFINVGRGDLIKNSSIVKALREGWISGAILDVNEEEPLPFDSPLWNMPEVHITPHIGAIPTCEQIAKFVAANYLRYVNGESLVNIVDWKSGY